jgi:hypothetical protein
MRTRFTILVCLSLLGVVVGAVPASATAPVNVTGTFTTDSAIEDVVWHGNSGNRTLYWQASFLFEGGMEGLLVTTKAFSHVNHNGDFAANSVGVFTGCVGDLCGTLLLRSQGTGGGPYADYTTNMVVLGGTGDLANVHGQGTTQARTGQGGTYSLNLHFDPAP